MEMTMIKKTILVSCMFATIPVIAGDHEFLTTNPYDVDVPYNPHVIIGVEKPRVVESKIENRTGVGIPSELQTPAIKPKKEKISEAEMGVPSDRSSFYEDKNMDERINSNLDTESDFDLFDSHLTDTDEAANTRSTSNFDDSVNNNSTNLPSAFISSNEIVSVVDQPKVNSYQRKLEGTPTAFLMVTKPSPRAFVSASDGRVYFHARKGTLEENLIELLSVTDTVFPLVYEVSNQHVNSTDVWIYGDTILDVLNSLLINYVEPHPIRASTYANRMVEIYYDKKNRQR